MTDARLEQGPRGGVTPHLTIPSRGAAAAIEFYARAFGAEEVMRTPAEDGERLLHVHLRLNGGSLMLADECPEGTGETDIQPVGVSLHLQVDDADEWWGRALVNGAIPVMPLADQSWGDRYGQLRDPFGQLWSIGGPKKA